MGKQLKIESGKADAILRIYLIVNAEGFLADVGAWKKGNKSAGRRARKKLLEVRKLATEARADILGSKKCK